jgi:hypothetical protein
MGKPRVSLLLERDAALAAIKALEAEDPDKAHGLLVQALWRRKQPKIADPLASFDSGRISKEQSGSLMYRTR